MKYMTVKIIARLAIIKQNSKYSKEIKAFGVQEIESFFSWFQTFYPSNQRKYLFLEQNDFPETQFGTNLRVVQTQAILFLKSMSEKVVSDDSE